MYEGSDSQFQNQLYQNIPNMAMAYTMYTTTFGNGAFMIQPASQGQVQAGFPSVPYLSLEALLYEQQSSNPATAPVNITSGQNIGQQNVVGTTTAQDSNGTSRYQLGFSSGQ